MTHTMRVSMGISVLAVGVVTSLGQAAVGQPGSSDESRSATMKSAMQRDLGLSAAEVNDRLAAEKKASKTQQELRSELGSSYAGAWFDATSGSLVVASTSAAEASTIRSAGAKAQQAERSEKQLSTYQSRLNAAKSQAPDTVPGWFVDVKSNSIVVQSRASGVDEAKSFVKKAGVPASAVTVKTSSEAPRALDVVGGNAYYIDNTYRCSVGFSVNGGFISAGHCGSPGSTTTSPTGTFAGSSFPGNDYSYVRTSDALVGAVNNYAGGTVAVSGSSEAPVGSSICRSGSTTGWRCGTIGARNSTVNYAEGSVTGLIRTNACAEGGDSGGSALSGNQAQGVTSGGSGNCTTGGTTYFQPVNEILSAYGLSLVRG